MVTRTLYLSLPANNVATGEPTITGTAQAGQELTADASPIMDTDGLPSSFTYQWVRVDADGTSNEEAISGEIAETYTLTNDDVGKKVKVQVSFTDELSGEEERTSAAYPSSGTVTAAANTTAPALLSVTVTSTPRKESDTYGAREHIEFTMTFDAPVTVTGDPTFAFDLGGASTATWYAGSGTTTLRFSHAVSGGSSGDQDTNGISWAENAIALNGGTIAGTDNAVAAVLTHVAQSNLAAHKVDGRTTAVTPATVTVAVTSTPTSLADTYGFGETIVITVTASEAVEVEGDPEFKFSLSDMGGPANDVPATYDRARSSATTIVFAYTVQAGDRDNNGIWIGDHSRTFMLDANDRIRTASQQIDIDRSHPEKGTYDDHKVNGSLGAPTVPPDPTAPTLVSATATTLTIEWTHPGDGGSPLTRNFIEYRVEGTTDWTNWYRGETPTPVTRAVITNLQSATAYDVRVHSRNAIGNSQWVQSATAFSTLAGTAATGAPTITGTAQVGETLTASTTGIADADGLTSPTYTYQWIRVDGTEADISGEMSSAYTLVDADLGKTLKVRVTFDDDAGNTETLTSAATATVTPAAGAPASPTNLSVTVGVGQVVLWWQHSTEGGPARSSYEYRFSVGAMISPDAMWQQLRTGPGTSSQSYYQVVKGLTNDMTHTFQVRAENAQGGSAPATVTATPISQPSCTIDELGDRRLLWQGQLTAGIREIPPDGNIETGYGVGGVDPGTLTPGAFTFRSTSYSVYPRTYEDFLNVVIREQDLDVWYPRDEVVDALRVHVCNTPYDFSSATTADVFVIDDSGTWIDAGLDLEETVPGLTNSQRYAFEVRAVNSAGPGAPARTAATPLGMPSVPESLTATGGDGEVVLEWTEPADDGGSPVTGYGYRYAAGQAVPEEVTWRDAGTELTATVSGLENETRYTFEVRARNRVGPGETSRTTALPLRLRAELFSSAAAEGEALVVGVRRSGRLAFPAHAYIGVTDSALPGVTATEEGRDDGLGRHRLEFAAGAAEATVTVTVAFDGERRQDRVLSATLDSAELEVDGVRRPYELVTPTLVVPVTEGDAGLSVADARVQGKSSVLAFTVSMDRTRDVAVRVDYATEDGSARAGEGYTPVSGTLTIEVGGREGTVEVPVLPALHVTGERTLTLRLSNAVSAVIDDGVATGVIVRESELPKAWLARFGRTASDHAAQAIARRLEAGQRETQVTVAGRRVDGLSVDGLLLGALPSGGWRPASAVEDMATRLAAPALAASGAPFGGVDADPGTPGLRAGTWGGAPGALDREPFADAGQTLRRAVLPDFGFRLPGAEEALMGTSFYVERGAQQDVGGGTWAAWGDVAATRFEGDAGGLALNGDVVTGTAGLDRQWRAVLVGLALSRSSGEGGYGTGAGTIASTLTSVHPYVQVRLGERAQVWGAAGWGRGGLEITPESGAMLEADLRNSMAALGCPGGAHGCRWARDRAAFRLPMDGDVLGRDRRAGGGGGHGEPRAADARGRGPDPRARRRRASQGRGRCALRRRGRGDRTGIRGGRRTRLGPRIADAPSQREDARRPR